MSPEETLQKWQDYINDYSNKVAVLKTETDAIINSSTATSTEKQNAQRDYEFQKAHLDELQAKLSSLQTYYAQHGELPDDVTFDGGKLGTFRYKTAADSEWFTGYARNLPPGSVYISSQHFSLVIEANGSGGTWGAYDGPNQSWFGIWNTGSVTWGSYHAYDLKNYMTEVKYSFVSVSNHTFFGCSVSDSLSTDVIPANTYAALSHTFTNGIIIEIPSDTVPTTSPWDYYNDDVLPNLVDPDDAIYPDGYTPTDPHAPTEEPDITDEDIDEGDLPTLHPDNILTSPSQFITQYILNSSELAYIGNMLWTSWLDANSDVWQNFLFNFASQTGTFNITAALDYVISLRVYPFDLIFMYGTDPPQDFFGTSYGVYMGTGKTNFLANSGITEVKTINSVCGAIDLGTCKVESDKPYNDFRDMYNASAICYLPFCGTVKLNPVDIWGRTLRCYYFIDFQSGGCTAVVECQGDVGWFPVASKSGQIGYTIPLTATNAGQLAATFAKDATQALGTMIAWGTSFDKKSSINENIESTANLGLSLADQAINMLSRSGVDMPMLSGGSGCEGIMMYHTPFIDIRRGKYAKPDNYPHSLGYVNSTSSQIGEYHGMNQFTGIDASGLDCHDDEKAEIIKLLESGVYLP